MTVKRNRKEAQREQTYQSLIEAAESLFAEQGIAAVSLRQIGERAGSLNTSVIAYYFGSKEALIEAIYRHRLPEIEQWRAEFLEDIDRRGLGMDLGELLKAIWMPWYQQRDEEGRHSYGRFLLRIGREDLGYTRYALDADFPASFDAEKRIRRYLDINKVPNPDYRFAMLINMILETLRYIDMQGLSPEQAEAIFMDALDMARAALLSGVRADP